jgi:hypothetical protein
LSSTDHAAEELDVLERSRDPALTTALGGASSRLVPSKRTSPCVRLYRRVMHVERGRLAGAVRPDQADDLSGSAVKRHAVERDDPAETLRDVFDLEEGQSRDSLRRMDRGSSRSHAKTLRRTAARAELARPLCGAAESAP